VNWWAWEWRVWVGELRVLGVGSCHYTPCVRFGLAERGLRLAQRLQFGWYSTSRTSTEESATQLSTSTASPLCSSSLVDVIETLLQRILDFHIKDTALSPHFDNPLDLALDFDGSILVCQSCRVADERLEREQKVRL
jgi:hypothetical protein